MWFWWIMLVFDLMIPVMLILLGLLMWKRTPKEINYVLGYRTSMSMKNMDTWRFAHEYCGRLWCVFGGIILIPSVIALIPFYGASDDVVGTVITVSMVFQMVIMIVPIIITEIALRKVFDKNGTKK